MLPTPSDRWEHPRDSHVHLLGDEMSSVGEVSRRALVEHKKLTLFKTPAQAGPSTMAVRIETRQ